MKLLSFYLIFFIAIPLSVNSENYDVDGYGTGGYVYGDIDISKGSKYVDGYLYNESGDPIYFDGEFTGYGTVEGYGDDGNYYELETY